MKRGFTKHIVLERFIGDGVTREFKIGDSTRPSVGTLDIHRDLDESSSIKHIFEHLAEPFFHLCDFPSGYFTTESTDFISPDIRSPGDVDILFVDKEFKNIHCFEAKRIKVSNKINKLSTFKTAKRQLNGYLKYELTTVSLLVIVSIRENYDRSYRDKLFSAIDQHIGRNWMKENGIGLVILEHYQFPNLSLDTKEMLQYVCMIPPIEKSTCTSIIDEVKKSDKLKYITLPSEEFRVIKLEEF